jgi:succinoglycan biosynthesis protein ExoM
MTTATELDAENPASRAVVPHVSVCVCTYMRPHMLSRLLHELSRQDTGGLFTFSIIVADNDESRSAEGIVDRFRAQHEISIVYCVEARRNIALARNKVVANASGDYIAFIDDDEFPEPLWLQTLFKNCNEYKVDGVLGPVKRHFDQTPPAWFKKSTIYDRPVNPTGELVAWEDARTGNVLLRRRMIEGEKDPFRPEFRAGEDQDFFRRKSEEGYTFIWSADAVVFETIPPARWKRRYILRKAALQGATAALQPNCGPINIVKSIIAVPLYLAISPFVFLLGQHFFMELMVKIFDHSGKLLMRMGINPIHEEYVSE